jgi:hypothetical protein
MSSARGREGGRGRGMRGRGIPNPKETEGKGGVSSSGVDEEMRIRLTSQLHQLRESQVSEVIFPSNLTNVVWFAS